MKRFFLSILSIVFPILLKSLAAEAPSLSASFKMEYNRVADMFHLMDQVSGATSPFFLITKYQEYWYEVFLVSDEDKGLFESFRDLRKKYRNASIFEKTSPKLFESPGLLFTPSVQLIYDPIAFVFYRSYTLDQAYGKLKDVLTPDEIRFLQAFFDHFASKIEHTLSENDLCVRFSVYLNTLLEEPSIARHLNQIARFYDVPPVNHWGLLFWAPREYFGAQSYGPVICLQMNPSIISEFEDAEKSTQLLGILMHEATHEISSKVPLEKKKLLSQRFLSRASPLRNEHFLLALEEPLASILGQILFIKFYAPNSYNPSTIWVSYPYPFEYLNSVKESFIRRKILDLDLIDLLAEAYKSKNKTEE